MRIHLLVRFKRVNERKTMKTEEVDRHYVQACMLVNGGSFAASLARSFQVADPTNYKRLRAAFPDIWERYAQMFIDAQPKEELGL